LFSIDRTSYVTASAPFTNYYENVRFVNGVRISNTAGTYHTLIAKNCDFCFNTTTNGLNIEGRITTFLEECEAYKNKADGFSYNDASSISCRCIEVRCCGFMNGENSTTSINNGSTSHGGTRILRIGGIYFENEGPNMHDVNNSRSLNIDCVAYSSVSTLSANKSAFALGAAASESCMTWLDGCTTHNENTTFGAEDRTGLGSISIRNCSIKNIEPGTILTTY
jgi:hypothetical protein